MPLERQNIASSRGRGAYTDERRSTRVTSYLSEYRGNLSKHKPHSFHAADHPAYELNSTQPQITKSQLLQKFNEFRSKCYELEKINEGLTNELEATKAAYQSSQIELERLSVKYDDLERSHNSNLTTMKYNSKNMKRMDRIIKSLEKQLYRANEPAGKTPGADGQRLAKTNENQNLQANSDETPPQKSSKKTEYC